MNSSERNLLGFGESVVSRVCRFAVSFPQLLFLYNHPPHLPHSPPPLSMPPPLPSQLVRLHNLLSPPRALIHTPVLLLSSLRANFMHTPFSISSQHPPGNCNASVPRPRPPLISSAAAPPALWPREDHLERAAPGQRAPQPTPVFQVPRRPLPPAPV